MGFKHRAKQVLGAVVVAASVWLALLMLRRLVVPDWLVGGILTKLYTAGFLVLNAALAVHLFYSGLRIVNPKTVSPSRFEWGKVIVGALILYLQVGFDYHLVPKGPLPFHMPSTPTQAASVLAFDLTAVYLIFRGVRAGVIRREPQRERPPA